MTTPIESFLKMTVVKSIPTSDHLASLFWVGLNASDEKYMKDVFAVIQTEYPSTAEKIRLELFQSAIDVDF